MSSFNSVTFKKKERRNSILRLCVLPVFWMPLIVLLGYLVWSIIILMVSGTEKVGMVIGHSASSCGLAKSRRTCYYHMIDVPGVGLFRLDLGKEFPLQTRIWLTYQEGNLSNARPGHRPTIGTLSRTELIWALGFFINIWLFSSFIRTNYKSATDLS